MIYKILLFLIVPMFAFAQVGINTTLFSSTDTIGTISTADSVQVQFNDGPWKLLTESVNDTAYVTTDDKVGEVTKIFVLADESYWTYTTSIKFRVINTGQDTAVSNAVNVGQLRGALTLFIRPDTVGTTTYYNKSTLEGN